jgi:hypothetical protein
MTNKTYKILMIALMGLWAGSCSDSFLDVPPQGAMNSEFFYQTMEQAEMAVTTAYGMFCKTTAWDRDIIMMFGDVPSDDAESGGDYENEVPDIEVFNRFGNEILTTNSHLQEMYGILYRGIYFANIAMEHIPNVLNTDPDADATIINRRIAEMKFVRAINYLYLTHIFGAVPLVDHVLDPSEFNQGRSTFRDLYDFIEGDLLDAISVLPERSAAEDIGRATKGAARGLLARLYLFESSYAHYYPGDERFTGLNERWQDVLDVCEDIINSGEYRLVGSDGETDSTWHGPHTDGYRFMFTVEGDNNEEAIFEVQFINDLQNYAQTRAGSLVQWTSPRYYTNSSGVKTVTQMWGLGWPTQNLYNEFEPGDIRLQTCISEPGDSIEVVMSNAGVLFPINFENTATGLYMNKYVCSAEQFLLAGGHGWQKSPANGKILRLGEVYLMAAEAAIMLGDNAKATTYINAIRSRARACGGGVGPADLTGTITMDQLIHERRVELAFEGRRFFDLVRWHMAEDRLNNTTTAGGFPIIYTSPKYDFMPLPAREITLSGGALEQYPGW